MIRRNFSEWADIIRRNGGLTINLNTEDMPLGIDRDLYSIGGTMAGAWQTTEDDLARVLAEMCRRATALGIDYLGAWLDTETGIYYVEPVTLTTDREHAERLGRERGELAIFNLRGAGTEIRL